jgi:hypothetical protein
MGIDPNNFCYVLLGWDPYPQSLFKIEAGHTVTANVMIIVMTLWDRPSLQQPSAQPRAFQNQSPPAVSGALDWPGMLLY